MLVRTIQETIKEITKLDGRTDRQDIICRARSSLSCSWMLPRLHLLCCMTFLPYRCLLSHLFTRIDPLLPFDLLFSLACQSTHDFFSCILMIACLFWDILRCHHGNCVASIRQPKSLSALKHRSASSQHRSVTYANRSNQEDPSLSPEFRTHKPWDVYSDPHTLKLHFCLYLFGTYCE